MHVMPVTLWSNYRSEAIFSSHFLLKVMTEVPLIRHQKQLKLFAALRIIPKCLVQSWPFLLFTTYYFYVTYLGDFLVGHYQ